MFSRLDRRAGLRFSLRLTLGYAALFIIASAGLYALSYALLDEALESDWDAQVSEVQASWSASERGFSEEVSLHVQGATAHLSRTLRQHTETEFRRTYLWLALGILVLSVLGGFAWTYRATRPLRRIVLTVQDILTTGELGRRVPAGGGRGATIQIVGLFNRMLDRNASLINAIHDSLDNVAHDLRTPMTRLRATAERALLQPDDHDACHEAVADCMEESERVLTMLNTLMEVAEAETGAMRLEKSRVALGGIVREALELYEFVAEERDVEVVTHVEEGLEVEADPNRLRQVIANLLDNAIKYGGRKTKVTISLERAGNEAVVAVADQGPGILAADLPRIWERLYRGDRSRTERGLGLGLSFVRAIVEAHGGRVEVESEVNLGSTFRIRLPMDGPGSRTPAAVG
jgi:signal transduction histidine kinase